MIVFYLSIIIQQFNQLNIIITYKSFNIYENEGPLEGHRAGWTNHNHPEELIELAKQFEALNKL